MRSLRYPGCRTALRRVSEVVDWRLCLGCGACACACENIRLEDVPGDGIRPVLTVPDCDGCGKCVEVCPGLGMAHHHGVGRAARVEELRKGWGPVIEIWEGYASDPAIRSCGSSGGAATAIALYCLEAGLGGSVVHVGKREEEPWRNKTVVSRSREELVSRTGSRYCPASPCEGLSQMESTSLPSVFMGKPCDIQGLRKTEALRPFLREKTALTIGIFCAGTPATSGLLDLLASLDVPIEDVGDVRFRGNGWPGSFTVIRKDGSEHPRKLSYEDSWGFVQEYRPFRCYLCPDGTSEFADISCGDAWYRPTEGDPGRSLVLARTENGGAVLKRAREAGYVHLERVDPAVLEMSQKNLLLKRSAIWGRLLVMKAFGLPVPGYQDFHLLENWLELALEEKARSLFGTAKRIVRRRYWRPTPLPEGARHTGRGGADQSPGGKN